MGLIKGKGKGKGQGKKGIDKLGYAEDWRWWGSDGQSDRSRQGMNSLAPQAEEPWMRRFCPMTEKSPNTQTSTSI